MTVLTSANKAIIAGDGVKTAFGFAFNAGYAQNAPSPAQALSYLSVFVTDAGGNISSVSQGAGANQCQITLNPPVAAALWGLGGTVNYNPGGVPLPLGSTLTVLRTIPLTQIVALANQGGLFPQTVEMAMDLLEFQIQQLNEQYGRAIVAAVSDPAPLPLPPVAQRANQGAAFDSNGNMIAGVLPASGVISSAMQGVVNAATLAAGRTAFGLGAIATEGIGAGLQDDGAGKVRVNSQIVPDAANQTVTAAFDLTQRRASGPLTYTLPRVNTLWNGFGFWTDVIVGRATFVPDSNDAFQGQASGAAIVVPPGSRLWISCDGANSGVWDMGWEQAAATPVAGGSFTNLKVDNTPGLQIVQVTVTADELVLPNANGAAIRSVGVTLNVNTGVVGLNGMDVGTPPANVWVYLFAIANSSGSIGGLWSLSATAPTLPAGYSFAKRLGAWRTDGASHLKTFLQRGRNVQYPVPSSYPTMISGAVAFAPFDTTAFFPPTASKVKGTLSITVGGAGGSAQVCAFNGPNAVAQVQGSSTTIVQLFECIEESPGVLYYSASGPGLGGTGVLAVGWEENI